MVIYVRRIPSRFNDFHADLEFNCAKAKTDNMGILKQNNSQMCWNCENSIKIDIEGIG